MDHSTPNLPSRSFEKTKRFYGLIGFSEDFHDDGWLILRRGPVVLEFFPYPKLKPSRSWFSCCLRLDDVNAFYMDCVNAGIVEKSLGHPRVHKPAITGGMLMGALLDPDGSLLRFINN